MPTVVLAAVALLSVAAVIAIAAAVFGPMLATELLASNDNGSVPSIPPTALEPAPTSEPVTVAVEPGPVPPSEAAPAPEAAPPPEAAPEPAPEAAPPPEAAPAPEPAPEAAPPPEAAPIPAPEPRAAPIVIDPATLPRTSNEVVDLAQRVPIPERAEDALMLYQRALDMDDGNPRAMAGMAEVYLRMNQAETARAWAERALERASGRASYHVLLGDALLQLGDRDGALAEFTEAYRLRPTSANVRRRLDRLGRVPE